MRWSRRETRSSARRHRPQRRTRRANTRPAARAAAAAARRLPARRRLRPLPVPRGRGRALAARAEAAPGSSSRPTAGTSATSARFRASRPRRGPRSPGRRRHRGFRFPPPRARGEAARGSGKTEVIDSGVDLERFRHREPGPLRDGARLGRGGPFYLCVGTLDERKNVVRLAEALRPARAGQPRVRGRRAAARPSSRGGRVCASSAASRTSVWPTGSRRATCSASRA